MPRKPPKAFRTRPGRIDDNGAGHIRSDGPGPSSSIGVRRPIGVVIVPAGRADRENAKSSSDSTRRVHRLPLTPALFVLVLTGMSGCSGRGNFLTGGPTVGQLKTSLAHAEVQNQQLQKQVAQLKTDNRSIEDRLVREELNNGDLTARLDNARNLLRGRGVELEERPRTASNSRHNMFDDEEDDLDSSNAGSRRTLPAGRQSRKTRRPPSVRIPGRIEGTLDEDEDEDAVSSRRPTWSPGGLRTSKSNSRRSSGDLVVDDQAFHEDQFRWTSIGDSTTAGKGPTARR